MKIVKNFLNEENIKAIEHAFFDPFNHFPWFLSQGVSELNDGFF